jgi:hypothetical protein
MQDKPSWLVFCQDWIAADQQAWRQFLAGLFPAIPEERPEHSPAEDATQPPTPLDALHRSWCQVSPEDRLRFLCEMLTPNERRALQFVFEDDDAGEVLTP